ncbi:MAG: branched-chain amino acid ABC transporter permease [Anaerolineae bacterium]
MEKANPSLKIGFYGGIVAVYISMVGMVETFGQRDLIKDIISLGHLLLLITVLGVGFLSARQLDQRLDPLHQKRRQSLQRSQVLWNGALAGLVVGVMMALLVIIAELIDIRSVLVNVSPVLIEIITFGQGTWVGAVILVILGTALGALGGEIFIFPDKPRRAIVSGFLWVAFFGTLSELIRVTLSRPGMPAGFSRIFVTSNGLTILGAVIVVVVAVVWALKGKEWRGRIGERVAQLPPNQQQAVRYSQWGFGLLILLLLPWIVGVFPSEVLVNIGIYVLMGFGINIVVGMAGLLDLGYVAFFAVGAYTTAILTTTDANIGGLTISFWAALPVVVILTGLAGLLVGTPVLKMRGDYLAIVTLGFGEIARFLALSDWFKPWLGGAQGIIKIPDISIGGLKFVGPQQLYYLFLIASIGVLFISWRLKGSRVGRAWVAMREDEQVADVMGINTVYYKLLAFAMGAMIASLSGALFSAKLGTIYPHSFNVLVSITALSLLIVGGIGSLPGVVVGAVVLVGLPELLREFSEFRLLFYGALLIVMMILRPEGLVPSVRRGRELHEGEMEQDAWLKAPAVEAAPTES